MAYRIRVTVDYDWTPDGSGFATVGQNQSNNPGYGAALAGGPVGNAQTLEMMVSEGVPGGDTPTSANFGTALTAAAADLLTLLNTAGAANGQTATPLSLVQGFATGAE